MATKVYENGEVIPLTPEYFLKEIHFFRNIICSKEYSLEQKENAFEKLLHLYISIENLDKESPIFIFFQATVEEWERRCVLEMFQYRI